MSRYAHVMCEKCFRKSKMIYGDVDLTDAYRGRPCCWCAKTVEYSLIVHRHPDAVQCEGEHQDPRIG